MPEFRVIEAPVAREERRIALLAQQHDEFLVVEAFLAEVDSDLPRGKPPRFKQHTLSVEDVLVQNDQA
jgi:hypothetical protein